MKQLRSIINRMPNFRKMHSFVKEVYAYNTRHDKEQQATPGNLADRGYHIRSSYCGQVGKDLIEHILTKLTPKEQ